MSKRFKPALSESSLVECALLVIERSGWSMLTLQDIAQQANLSEDSVRNAFSDESDLLRGIARYIDAKSFRDMKVEEKNSAHDRLFDALMARFDALQEHRKAFVTMIADSRRDPRMLRKVICLLRESMDKTLHGVGLDRHNSVRQALIVTALECVYLLTLRAWSRDESPDMARTMAALDRYLRRAEKSATALRIV